MPRGRVDVMLVCSSGGHLLQLLALASAWDGRATVWVTNDRSDARSLLARDRAYFLSGPFARNPLSFVRNLVSAVRLVARNRPAVLVSTGADVAVPFAWLARLTGARVVYVESFTRIDAPSMSCRLIAPVADRIYVQWPDLVDAVPRARCVGAVVERS